MPDPRPGTGDRTLAKTRLDMDIYVDSFLNNPPMQETNVGTIIDNQVKTQIEDIIDSELQTAMTFNKGHNRDENSWNRSAFESKAIQDIGFVIDAKQHRQWNEKRKNAHV